MGVVRRWLMLRIRVCEWGSFLLENGRSQLMFIGRFVKVLVIEIFSSVLGLFGLIIGLLVSGKAPEFSA